MSTIWSRALVDILSVNKLDPHAPTGKRRQQSAKFFQAQFVVVDLNDQPALFIVIQQAAQSIALGNPLIARGAVFYLPLVRGDLYCRIRIFGRGLTDWHPHGLLRANSAPHSYPPAAAFQLMGGVTFVARREQDRNCPEFDAPVGSRLKQGDFAYLSLPVTRLLAERFSAEAVLENHPAFAVASRGSRLDRTWKSLATMT